MDALREHVGDAVRIPLDERMAALIPFRSQGSYRYVSATDVIRGTLGADELKDRIVLVGTSARGLVDVRATPAREDLPGVEIHASLISGALDNAMKSRPTETIAIAMLTILLVGIPFAVFLRRLSALAATLAVAGVLAVLLGVNAWARRAARVRPEQPRPDVGDQRDAGAGQRGGELARPRPARVKPRTTKFDGCTLSTAPVCGPRAPR